jgi:hypothetical protein
MSPTRNQELYPIQREARPRNKWSIYFFFSASHGKTEWNALNGSPPVRARLVSFLIFTEFSDINFNGGERNLPTTRLESRFFIVHFSRGSNATELLINKIEKIKRNDINIQKAPDTELLVRFTGLQPFFYFSGGGERSSCRSRHIHWMSTTTTTSCLVNLGNACPPPPLVS